MSIAPLPRVMVAPNGARKQKSDHPAVPITIAEVAATAAACQAEGADGLHAHVRDAEGGHVLDAGLYSELLQEVAIQAPGMLAQITTEAVGRYTPREQRAVVRDVKPKAVSVALREMLSDPSDSDEARVFYHWVFEERIALQHILYDAQDVCRLSQAIEDETVVGSDVQVLFVLGRYAAGQQSQPRDLIPFLSALNSSPFLADADWAICAFGDQETACLSDAVRAGGKVRVGFENSLMNSNGRVATDNAERVADVMTHCFPN